MLYEVMRHIRNYFLTGTRIAGEFHIEDGSINLPLIDGQYFLVEGSILNDGVYKYPTNEMKDETFSGYIVPLAVPQDFVNLCTEIDEFNKKNKPGQYISESFAGYSYSKATDRNGNVASWETVFKKRLDVYRKI